MPRKVNWGTVNAQLGGGNFAQLPKGGYIVIVTDCKEVGGKFPRVEIAVEVADGPHKDALKDAYEQQKTLTLWTNDNGLSETKAHLEAIAAACPGFDPFAAWDADRLDMFVGKVFGMVFREEETYTGDFPQAKDKNKGVVRTRTVPYCVVPIEAVRTGTYEVPELKKLSAAKAEEARQLREEYGNGEYAQQGGGYVQSAYPAPAQQANYPAQPAPAQQANYPAQPAPAQQANYDGIPF